ncbi:MAG TPA: esterase-like activity of phytase family protein, partial [Kofleriaceae bacterium]|nr:esterase-like activity of phytase family protein [Kofleriaceae bacterium]
SGACGKSPGIDRDRAAALFTEVEVATAPGLSGLAADDDGGLWTIAERDARAYRIVLDGSLRPAIETFTVEGVPADTDLEGIAVLGGDRFALGTEGHDDGTATVLVAERRGATLAVTRSIALPERAVGIHLKANQGAEGVCGAGDTIIAAIEGAGEEGGRRWAPVLRIAAGAIARTHRLWLTTRTGKISGLDCRIAADGAVDGWAIERHFEVTRLLRFALPPPGRGPDDVTPTVALDLGAVLNGKLNLEGIAVLPDGRVVAVVDNQWKTITGPSELLVFRPDAVRGTDIRAR